MVRLGVIVCVMLLVAWMRVRWWQESRPHYIAGQKVRVTARVRNFTGRGYENVEGVLIRLPWDGGIEYGDGYVATGKLEEKVTENGTRQLLLNTENFEVVHEGGGWVETLVYLRRLMVVKLTKWLGGDEGALAAGILLGGTGEMSNSARESFRRAGLSHVVAASGYNVSVVAGWVGAVGVAVWGRRRAVPFVIGSILLYVFLAGATAAVMRAGLMAILAIIGMTWGRKTDGYWLLGVGSWLMIMWDPGYLSDVGFQLSVAATVGVLLAGRGAWWSTDLKTTFMAQLTTLPLILHYFGDLSVVALPVNSVVLWTVPVIMQILGLAVGVGVVFDGLGMVASWLVWPLLRYVTWIVDVTASWRWASLTVGPVGWGWVVGYYGILILLVYKFRKLL